MRTLPAFVVLVLPFTLPAQVFERVEVVKVDSTQSATELFRIAERWFVDAFRDADEVLQIRDSTVHTLVGKGWTEFGPYAQIFYSVEVSCKDGRYRVRVYDVHHKGHGVVNTGYATAPVPSFGQIFDNEVCYTPQPTIMQGETGATRSAIKTCNKMLPEVKERVEAVITSLKSAMVKKVEDW